MISFIVVLARLSKEADCSGTGTKCREASADPDLQPQLVATKATARDPERAMAKARRETANGTIHRIAEPRATRKEAKANPRWVTGGRTRLRIRKRIFANIT